MILKVVKQIGTDEGMLTSEKVTIYQLGEKVIYDKIQWVPVKMWSDDKSISKIILITPDTEVHKEGLVVNSYELTDHIEWCDIQERMLHEKPMTSRELFEEFDEIILDVCNGVKFYRQEGVKDPFIVNEGQAYLMNNEGKTIERL